MSKPANSKLRPAKSWRWAIRPLPVEP
jgi:hypothetical protein